MLSLLQKFLVACSLFFVTPGLTTVQATEDECPAGCISQAQCKAKTKAAKSKGKKKGKKKGKAKGKAKQKKKMKAKK